MPTNREFKIWGRIKCQLSILKNMDVFKIKKAIKWCSISFRNIG